MPLSVLDVAPVAQGSTVGQALHDAVALARHVEELGFTRFWVAEHHNMPAIASASPAVLISHAAAATRTIRVGSGGVMLPNHAPLVVAEQFGMLEALHPGRIDLGIGRAPGTDQATARALRRTAAGLGAEDFPQELGELFGFFQGFPEGHPYRAIAALPGSTAMPDVWLLGSSGYSAQLAGALGLPFAFAHHFSGENTVAALRLYWQSFRPSRWLSRPYALISVATICADTDERARWLAGPTALSFLLLRSGRPVPLPTPEEAAAYPYDAAQRQFVEDRRRGQAVGSPETVRQRLTELLAVTGADELMLTTMTHGTADRLRSFELVATEVAPKLTRPPQTA